MVLFFLVTAFNMQSVCNSQVLEPLVCCGRPAM